MAKLSEKTIEDLQQIIRDEYGRYLTVAETRILAKNLVGYFDLLAQIHHREHEDRN